MLHGCTMVYDDAETKFSWQKNTPENIAYQNAYRRVNNLFAQEILRYCKYLKVIDKTPIIWINGYHLMLLPRDLRLYLANMNRSYRLFVSLTSRQSNDQPSSQIPNLYTGGSIASSASVLSPTNDFTMSPFSAYSNTPRSPTDSVSSDECDHESLFSPGPTFVDNLEDDMDDERMMVLGQMSY